MPATWPQWLLPDQRPGRYHAHMTGDQATMAQGVGAAAARRPPRDVRLAPWRAFVIAHARVRRRLDDDLRVEHGLSLPEYEALLFLAEAADRRLRMSQLADSLILSRSGVTRLVDRLVDDGLVERNQCTTDARGAEALLTDAGADRLRSAARTHLRGIRDYFLDAIEAADLGAIERVLGEVAARNTRNAAPAPNCFPGVSSTATTIAIGGTTAARGSARN
jgi:DNA-binding MarR family transcriptional regulator